MMNDPAKVFDALIGKLVDGVTDDVREKVNARMAAESQENADRAAIGAHDDVYRLIGHDAMSRVLSWTNGQPLPDLPTYYLDRRRLAEFDEAVRCMALGFGIVAADGLDALHIGIKAGDREKGTRAAMLMPTAQQALGALSMYFNMTLRAAASKDPVVLREALAYVADACRKVYASTFAPADGENMPPLDLMPAFESEQGSGQPQPRSCDELGIGTPEPCPMTGCNQEAPEPPDIEGAKLAMRQAAADYLRIPLENVQVEPVPGPLAAFVRAVLRRR
jgi:hypothetical protein